MRTAEHPRPRRVLAHFSDLHLRHPDDPLVRGVLDPRVPLAELLAGLLLSGFHPDALVFTGDLSDDGTPESYREFRALVGPVAEQLGAEVVVVNGNHDDRSSFAAELLGGATGGPLNRVHRVGGLRVLCLDTTVPGQDAGAVAPESLDWLAAQLHRRDGADDAADAPQGTLLAMHHAPLPVVQDLAASWELVGQSGLAEVVAGSGLLGILAGHFHQTGFGSLAGIPVFAATSTCYTQDLFAGRGMRGQDGCQGFSLVEVREGSVSSTAVPIGRHRSVTTARSQAESQAELARRLVRIAYA